MAKKLPQLLLEARDKQELTQIQVAKKAGIYPNTYSRIERGEQKPSIPTLRKLAKALDLDLSDLLKVWP